MALATGLDVTAQVPGQHLMRRNRSSQRVVALCSERSRQFCHSMYTAEQRGTS